MTADRVIIVDWGTSSFRAWLVDAVSGAVLDEVPDGQGMRALSRQDFAAYCGERLAPWRRGDAPAVYLCGMVGAPQGWQAAPQPPLPVTVASLAAEVVAVPDMPGAFIIPGARRQDEVIDVMRGEEVQIFGAMAETGRRDALLCLPGTHSKWARVEGAALTAFTTSMTGEVFEVMLDQSILGLTASRGAAFDAAAFDAGLDQAAREGGLLHHMFTARSRGLYGGLAPEAVESYLSGLLIGAETRAMLDLYPEARQGQVLLVCASRLRLPYERAFLRADLSARWIPGRDATLRGARSIAARHRALSSPETSP